MNIGWHDIEEIAIQLAERFPQTDPLTVRFYGSPPLDR